MLKTRPSPYLQLRHALDHVDVAFNKQTGIGADEAD
jgi:hypothetical protein